MMAMDELNVIESSKTLYRDLEKENEEAFLEIARARYRDITGHAPGKVITAAWLLAFLAAYNPVTEFVYTHEVERKQARFAESMIASRNKLEAIRRAMSLWIRQTQQFGIMVEDHAVITAYKAIGVKRVRWITQIDERRCPDCAARHKNVYPINRIPPKPHWGCRCYFIPEDEEYEEDEES